MGYQKFSIVFYHHPIKSIPSLGHLMHPVYSLPEPTKKGEETKTQSCKIAIAVMRGRFPWEEIRAAIARVTILLTYLVPFSM